VRGDTGTATALLGRRLHGEIGLIPPAELENDFFRHNTAPTTVPASVPSLH
jgi:putative transposase